jgi:hypothetical protein
MTLTDPRESLADQSSFISYLLGLSGLARVVHALAANNVHAAGRHSQGDDFVHLLLGLVSLGEAVERLTAAPAQVADSSAAPTELTRWLR